LDKIKVLEVLPEKHFLSTKHTKARPAKLCPLPQQEHLLSQKKFGKNASAVQKLSSLCFRCNTQKVCTVLKRKEILCSKMCFFL